MKKIFNKIISFLLLIVISINMIGAEHVRAQALPNYTYPTFQVIEGGGGVSAGTGPTAGGVLAIISGLAAAAWQVNLIVDNWGEFTDYIGDIVQFGQGWTDKLWNQTLGNFVHVETGKTLLQAVADGDDINYFEFYGRDMGNVSLDITQDMWDVLESGLADTQGTDSLDPSKNDLQGKIQTIISQYDYENNVNLGHIIFNWPELLEYDNHIIVWQSSTAILSFFVWHDNNPLQELKATVENNNSIMCRTPTNKTIDVWRLYIPNSTSSYGMMDIKRNMPIGSSFIINLADYQTYVSTGEYRSEIKMMKALVPFDLIQENMKTFNAPMTFDISNYKVPQGAMKINLNEYVENELQKVGGLDKINDTDTVVEIVKRADNIARENYDEVLPEPISNTSSDTVNIPILSDIWEWLQNIWEGFIQACKNVLQWAFVPADGKVQEFIETSEQIINSNGNILTYPIELVIIYLNKVLTMTKEDCIMTIPEISYKGKVLYSGTTFNFTEYINRSEFASLYNYYILFINALMIIWVCNLAIKKGDEIIRGN